MNPLDPRRAALYADLNLVKMAAACWAKTSNPKATFEVSFPELPPGRGYVLAGGIEQVAQCLLEYRFQDDQLHFLRNLFTLHEIPPEFWDAMAEIRFTGDLRAAPEGTPMFPGEPLLRITAPLIQGLLLDTFIMTTVAHQSAVMTNTARLVTAAAGKEIVEVASRFSPGASASITSSRAAYLAGSSATSNMEAAHQLGVPIFGDMSRHLIDVNGEEAAFRAFQETYPSRTAFELDSRNPVESAKTVVALDASLHMVRLDGAPDPTVVGEVRQVLDGAGFAKTRIAIGGDLTEASIAEYIKAEAPIDSFEVGAAVVSPNAGQWLDYRLVAVETDGEMSPRGAFHSGTATLPGPKQVYRQFDSEGRALGDSIALVGEGQSGTRVLAEVLKAGVPVGGRPGLETIRNYTQSALDRLPEKVRRLHDPEPFPVTVSDGLEKLRERLVADETA